MCISCISHNNSCESLTLFHIKVAFFNFSFGLRECAYDLKSCLLLCTLASCHHWCSCYRSIDAYIPPSIAVSLKNSCIIICMLPVTACETSLAVVIFHKWTIRSRSSRHEASNRKSWPTLDRTAIRQWGFAMGFQAFIWQGL